MTVNELPPLPPRLHWYRYPESPHDIVRDDRTHTRARVWHYPCGTRFDAEIFTPPTQELPQTWCQSFDNPDDARRVLAMRLWLGEFT
jgi:hypothetical protein